MKKVENESPLRRNLHRAPSSRARYCLNDPSIDSREREKIRKAVVEKGNGEGNENSKSWRFFFFFFFSNGSASRSKAQTMLISQRVSSIYKSIPGGCLAPSPCVCVSCIHRRVYFSFYPRKETFISRNFIPFRPLDREDGIEKTKIMADEPVAHRSIDP